jgi:hypothetical protein
LALLGKIGAKYQVAPHDLAGEIGVTLVMLPLGRIGEALAKEAKLLGRS